MKIALSSYAFHKALEEKTMTQLDCIKKTKELGFDGIEFAGVIPHDDRTPQEYAHALREACEKEGLPIFNYVTGGDFLNGSGGDIEAEIECVKGKVDIAEILGVSCMRHDCTYGVGIASFGKSLPRLAYGCREVTKYAEQKGISTMVENHGRFCQDSIRVEQLVDAVNHDNFGLLVDMGNFLCADDDPATAVSRVARQAFYIHAKDFIVKSGNGSNPGRGFFMSRGKNWLRGTVLGHGVVPVRQCLTTLIGEGYDGNITLEYEGDIERRDEAIAISLENLHRYISEAREIIG